jgi:hypothetical protein
VFMARPPSLFSPVWHLPQWVLRIGMTSWTKSSSSANEDPVNIKISDKVLISRLLRHKVNSAGTPKNGGNRFDMVAL